MISPESALLLSPLSPAMDANLRARLAELEQRFAQLQEDNDAAVGDDDDDLCEEVGASREIGRAHV